MSLTDPEFELSGTRYRVRKLPAIPAAKLLLEIREEIGNTIGVDGIKRLTKVQVDTSTKNVSVEGGDTLAALVQLALTLRTEYIVSVADQLFEYVTFQNEQAQTHQSLAGAQDLAFNTGGEPFDYIEVIVRCIAVNFGGSSQRLVSRLLGALPNTIQSLQRE